MVSRLAWGSRNAPGKFTTFSPGTEWRKSSIKAGRAKLSQAKQVGQLILKDHLGGRDDVHRGRAMSLETERFIEEITAIIVREVDPKQLILFGSQVMGAARPAPDLDFPLSGVKPVGSRWPDSGGCWPGFLFPKTS
jgi:hypothetical protein